MKALRYTFRAIAFACVFLNSGCRLQSPVPHSGVQTDNDLDACTRYAPDKIDIAPLTEYLPADETHPPRINLYVSLLDTFGSQIKSPGTFRFELYEHVPRSAKSRGKRLHIWRDADLTDPKTNSEYWRDFLRAYEFTLPLDQSNSKSHILQVTYFCPTGKLLTSEFALRKLK